MQVRFVRQRCPPVRSRRISNVRTCHIPTSTRTGRKPLCPAIRVRDTERPAPTHSRPSQITTMAITCEGFHTSAGAHRADCPWLSGSYYGADVEDFVAYPSRQRIGAIILGSIAFVVAGLWLVAFGLRMPPAWYRSIPGPPPPPVWLRSSVTTVLVGLVSVIFFGMCALVSMNMLFDTHEQLRIGTAGIRWSRWSDQTIPWSQISDVTIWSFWTQKDIVLHLRNPALFPGRGILGMAGRANRALTGGDICISLTGTDRSFDEATSAITRLRS